MQTSWISQNPAAVSRSFETIEVTKRMTSSLTDYKSIRADQLINILNKVNFHNGSILVNFKHPKYDRTISLKARPQPCRSTQVECTWNEELQYYSELTSYKFINFSFDDGFNQFLVNADIQDVDADGIKFILPEKGFKMTHRLVKRNLCQDIIIQLIQNSMVFKGRLIEFSSASFSVEIVKKQSQSTQWINSEHEVFVLFQKHHEVLYSGKCEIVREVEGQNHKQILLRPLKSKINRFKSKQTRSIRQTLSPTPNIVFRHPFTGKIINLNIVDLSGSGLSVEEDPQSSVLLPGMIIPELGIELMRTTVLNCKAQVLYNNMQDNATFRCGFTILDMETQDHMTLSNLLYRAEDNNSRFSTNGIDLDALWDFFFETGFVYPKKYAFIKTEKQQFKKLYNKLYSENPDFARQVIYQDKGKILGHVSMLRCYEKAWIIQHHAAITSLRNRAGFIVMQLIGRYANEFHRLRSSYMNYVACYFRPQSRFPDKAFGDVARKLENPKGCSLDSFAYYYFSKIVKLNTPDKDWTLNISTSVDHAELINYYEDTSGGLMLDAMNLKSCTSDTDSNINHEYKRLGFKRQQLSYSLKKGGVLKAVFLILISDVGLNMSDLTNCIHVIVIDSNTVNKKSLDWSLNTLIEKHYGNEAIPILFSPTKTADDLNIEYEKIYNLWVLNLEFLDFYFQHVDKLLNRRKRNKRT